MTYATKFIRHPTYIHAIVTGANTKEAVKGYMEDVREECVKDNCRRVLVEENLDGPRLKVIEIFGLITGGIRDFVGVFDAFAYVDRQAGEMGQFAENVAFNRGFPVKVFESVADAEAWLQSK